MTFNWAYYPLETNGHASGVQNPLPNFEVRNGNPWSSNTGWFVGDGSSTSLFTQWNTAPILFEQLALPNNACYLIGFQVDLGAAPASDETILFCGFNDSNNTDGVQITYKTTGKIRPSLMLRNHSTIFRDTLDIRNKLRNLFFYIDHRPAGIGIDQMVIHMYENITDIKYTEQKQKDLRGLGGIYPQEFTSSTGIIVGAMHSNGIPIAGTHFSGKIRRLHIMNFGALADDVPSNIAELMGRLSEASMVPTSNILQFMGFPSEVSSYSFVDYV